MVLKLLIIPVIGGFIGWVTNVLAIKLIFWPYEAVKMPLLGVNLQGLIPKRRGEIAANVGKIIERELLSVDDLLNYFGSDETKKRMSHVAIDTIRNEIEKRFPKYIPATFTRALGNIFEDVLRKEIPIIVDRISSGIGNEIKESLDLAGIIEDKLNCFDVIGLESLVIEVANKELGHIKIMGAILGFLIGLIQVGFVVLIFPG